jgi:hypothetical protein
MLTKAIKRPTIRQHELFAATELKFRNAVIAGILLVAGGYAHLSLAGAAKRSHDSWGIYRYYVTNAVQCPRLISNLMTTLNILIKQALP